MSMYHLWTICEDIQILQTHGLYKRILPILEVNIVNL